MSEEIKKFIESISRNSDKHALELLMDVLVSLSKDKKGKTIVENIVALNFCDISLIDGNFLENYVYTEDDKTRSEIHLDSHATEFTATHEFGHLLIDLFADLELPRQYFKINKRIKQRLLGRKKEVSKILGDYRDYLFSILLEAIKKSSEYIEKNSDSLGEYIRKRPDMSLEELNNEIVVNYYFYLSSNDKKARNINIVGNIIDSLFHGRNPFYKYYGNESFHPLISAHDPAYFLEGDEEKHYVGFQEQFAEYLVLMTYKGDMSEAISILAELLGNDWFMMMDEYYKMISSRVQEKRLNMVDIGRK